MTIASKILNDIAQLQTRLNSCTRNRKQLNFRCQESTVVVSQLSSHQISLIDQSKLIHRGCLCTAAFQKTTVSQVFYSESVSCAVMFFYIFISFFCLYCYKSTKVSSPSKRWFGGSYSTETTATDRSVPLLRAP